jgi:hypothetical protein
MALNKPVTYSGIANFQITQRPPAGIKDPVVAAAMEQVYNAIQQLILIESPGAIGGNTVSVITSEAIAYGAAVNLYSNAGVITARNANSSVSGKQVNGFCTSTSGISSGSTGFICLGAMLLQIPSASLTLGSNYWLAPTAGGIQTTADTTAGHIEQYVGIALSSTSIFVKPGSWIQH